MHDFFKTLMHPDREEDPAKTVVARAANALQVGEFQFLQLAYFDWFGEELPKESLDDVFRIYMIRGQIPAWARHYAREVLQKEAAGLLDDNNPSYHRYDQDYVTHVPQGMRRFITATLCLVFVMSSALAIGALSTGHSNQVLPPFFDERQLPSGEKGPGAS